MISRSRRLNLHFVPGDPDSYPIDAAHALFKELRAREVVDDSGGPGSGADWLVAGGFRRVRIDDPGRQVLYANQVGGFHVRCPLTCENVAPSFRAALIAWRSEGPRSLECSACGERHALEALSYAPPAAFGRLCIVVADVETAVPQPLATARVAEVLGPFNLVQVRV